ncbi:DNA polymerase III subunit gamma/tau [Clostridium sp. N3C]|uniref:DNA polymerase III subunit gamma/tau n=1 Tax=Clostridium sp. N3C TaxID=1776758 RepID=UPI00092DEF0D|nr:DNA polymerase III subunit gamma/tau [Clostridium sp. N3C]SCN25995.1 DNA polymerase III subunit gamma/tau [Clostridium sp. N3C]
MAYKALYREWRPRTFDDVVGQKHITVTLKNQILKGRTAHAYLFCGTRGTGKTSTAKIMAKALNCLQLKDGEPCNECEMCKKINDGIAIDVVELDAASNNGIDNIRDIIEDVQYPPQEARYKVYIMDEVHMLSTGAVNAFLKTLEEPPKNVIFILATTDPQKLPITILSRCQRFDFKRIKSEDIFKRLRKIVDQEGVYAEDRSLQLVARIADGAMRDSLSVLDQAISMGGGKVDYDNLISMLGLVTNENLLNLMDAVINKNIEESLRIVDDVVLSGKDVYTFIKDLITHLRNLMITKVSNTPEEILDMSLENIAKISEQAQKMRMEDIMRSIRILQEAEEQAKWSRQSRIYLELALIKMCKVEYDTSKEVLLSRINRLEEVIRQGKIVVNAEKAMTKQGTQQEERKTVTKASTNVAAPVIVPEVNPDSKVTLEMVKKSWRDIMETFKARRQMVLYASLVTGKPIKCSNGVLEILYDKEYAFNKQRLEKEDNRRIVEDIFYDVLRERIKVRYIIESEGNQDRGPEDIILETFGEEVVEIIDD